MPEFGVRRRSDDFFYFLFGSDLQCAIVPITVCKQIDFVVQKYDTINNIE